MGVGRTSQKQMSGDQHNFAVSARLKDFLVGSWGFGERKLFANNGAEAPIFETRANRGVDRGHFIGLNIPQEHPEDCRFARHDIARSDLDVAAAADDDDAAAHGEHFQIGAKIYVGKHFEDDVSAVVAGDFHDARGKIGRAMIQNVVRAFLCDEFAAAVGAGRANDAHAYGTSELDASDADSTARSMDEQPFVGTRVRELK